MSEPEQKRKAGGKPFQSKLEPFFDLIRDSRKARKTWEQIAQLIRDQGTDCTVPGVYQFFKAKRKRRYALGMEPDPAPAPVQPAAAVPESSESPRAAPSPSHPLTQPKPTTKPTWTVKKYE